MPISPEADNVLPSVEQPADDPPPPYTSREEVEPADGNRPIFGFQAETLGEMLSRQRRVQNSSAELPEDLQLIMDAVLTENEARAIVTKLAGLLRPGYMYWVAATIEENRIDRRMRPWRYKCDRRRRHINDVFQGRLGKRRLGIFVRHNVKRRWEALNIWNPKWGFPGRSIMASDDANTWQWPWEEPMHQGFAHSEDQRNSYYQKLLARAMAARMGFYRHQEIPSSTFISNERFKPQNATEAEQWLISRPWLIFQIEVAEESVRYRRLPSEQRRRHPHHPREQVIKWWKNRGDWRDEFDLDVDYSSSLTVESVNAWTWRNECPSPEPESITSISPHHRRPLQETGIDFSESEVEDLETNELPENQKPLSHWSSTDYFYNGPPHVCRSLMFPGQTCAEEQPVASEQTQSVFGLAVQEQPAFGDAVDLGQPHGAFGFAPRQPQDVFGLASEHPQGLFGSVASGQSENPIEPFDSPFRRTGHPVGAPEDAHSSAPGGEGREDGDSDDEDDYEDAQDGQDSVDGQDAWMARMSRMARMARIRMPRVAWMAWMARIRMSRMLRMAWMARTSRISRIAGVIRMARMARISRTARLSRMARMSRMSRMLRMARKGLERHGNDNSQVPQGEETPASLCSSQEPRRRRPVAQSRQPRSAGSRSSLQRSTRITARRRPAEEESGPTAPNKRRRVPGGWSSVTVGSPTAAAPALPNCLLM